MPQYPKKPIVAKTCYNFCPMQYLRSPRSSLEA
jgi:hypothetical protein